MPPHDDLPALVRAAGLTIGEPRAWALARPAPDAAALAAALGGDGYLELPGLIPPALVAAGRAAVELIVARGVPAVCAFAFDPFWQLVPLLASIATEALGGPVDILDSFWAWHVAGGGARGWPPHRDRPSRAFTDDDRLASITLWVALTDATLRNGCIHVAPACWDYEYRNPGARDHLASIQHIRALPAAAGTVLGWTHALLHWGTAAAAGEPPRISVAFEFVRAGVESTDDAFPVDLFPGLADRCAIIGHQIAKYQHMHALPSASVAPVSPVLGALRRAFG